MVCRWAQEILSCNFTIVHRSNKIMFDVDPLTRHSGHFISHHISISSLLISRDLSKRPRAHATTKFSDFVNVNITETDNPSSNPPPLLISDVLHQFFNIAPRIQPYPIHYRPTHCPLSQHFLFRCAHPLTSAEIRLFATLSHQALQLPPCRSLNPSKFDAFESMPSLVIIPTGIACMAMAQLYGHFEI